MSRHHHSLMREAVDAGFLGAVAVFLWFLFLDTVAGRPLWTPNRLGQAVLFGGATAPGLDYLAIVAYTSLSLAGLILLGVVIVGLVHIAIRQPTLLFALLLLFVMFEVFFLGATYAVLHRTALESVWWPVLGANMVAVMVMGSSLRRRHRLIDRWVARVPLGDTGDEQEVRTPAAWHAMGQWRGTWRQRITSGVNPRRVNW